MNLTPSTLRLDLKCGKGAISVPVVATSRSRARRDAAGRRCGQGYIPAGKQCRQNGNFPTHKAIAAGLGVAAIGAGTYALNRRRNRIVPVRVSFAAPAMVQPGSPRVSLPGDRTTRRLTGSTPRGLLPPSPPRLSKTARMRANTGAAVRTAERDIARAARAEIERIGTVGNAMASAGEATGMAAKTGWRELRLRTEAARRRFEPGYRRGQRFQGPRLLAGGSSDPLRVGLTPRSITPQRLRLDTWATGFTTDSDGKKYTKVVTNPETGRKNRVRYGAKGYTIAPGTNKGDRYCARSFGDMKSHSKNCAGADRNTPLCLSRAKWKCSGKRTRRSDALTLGKSSAW